MAVDFDVAIIGAGPSGSTCALALQGKGLKVALIDKEAFPRDKICGDAIPGSAFKAISRLRSTWGDQMKAFTHGLAITSIAIFFSKRNVIRYTWKLFSYNSKRIDFDHFLFQLVKKETNTHILEHKQLQQVTATPDYCQCLFSDGSSIHASVVVGCDGAYSVVKRNLIDSEQPDSLAVTAIRAYYKGIKGIQAGCNEAHLIKEVQGYFWIFPLRDGWANVGFGLFKNKNRKDRAPVNLRTLLEEITQSPAFADRFKDATVEGKVNGFSLPIWTRQRSVSGHRFLLCGDAASLIDPLQGHGIDLGMWSGVMAAEQIGQCFTENDFSSHRMKAYDRALHQKFGPELSRNYFLMRLFLRFPILLRVISKFYFPKGIINWLFVKLKL
ncbi:MAG: NAD(P)/FAD-dependent oxidoreductase [Cyclobacteriaceae bacterium]|nr:NAD(P)/FAD-dependent oxidoreductase [Cyclobacteriaceae bacterium]